MTDTRHEEQRTARRLAQANRVFKRVRRLHGKDSLEWMIAIRRVWRVRGDGERANLYRRYVHRILLREG